MEVEILDLGKRKPDIRFDDYFDGEGWKPAGNEPDDMDVIVELNGFCLGSIYRYFLAQKGTIHLLYRMKKGD